MGSGGYFYGFGVTLVFVSCLLASFLVGFWWCLLLWLLFLCFRVGLFGFADCVRVLVCLCFVCVWRSCFGFGLLLVCCGVCGCDLIAFGLGCLM